MRLLRLLAPALTLDLFAAPVALAQPEPRQALDTAAVLAGARPEISAANRAWVSGLRQRNAEMIAAAYADSGLFIAPDGAVTRGRAAIKRMYAVRFPQLRVIRDGAVIQAGLVVVDAGSLYEWGNAWLEQEAPKSGGLPVRSGGPYLTVWQRQADGHWRIVRNIVI